MSPSYRVPMSAPDIRAEDIDVIRVVLESGELSQGPFVDKFEREFAKYTGSQFAVAVSNGTAGLHLCICAAEIGEGDEVITTPFSFVASANCVLYERARPVFVDIDETTLNIDPSLVRNAVTARTRALVAVHVFGQPCALTELNAFCKERNVILIEDACEAVGSEYRGRRTGTFGKAAVFAFYPNKQITTGEGGIVTTNDPKWNTILRSLRNQGRSKGGAWLHHERLGYNYRLNEMSAALGFSQLQRIDELLHRREIVAKSYDEMLRGVEGIVTIGPIASTTRLSRFVYVVRLAPEIDRGCIIAKLEEMGVPSRAYFSPIHLQPYFRSRFGYREGDFPVTERVASSTLALPFHGNLAIEDIKYVVQSLRAALLGA